jgi:hypothetical protein
MRAQAANLRPHGCEFWGGANSLRPAPLFLINRALRSAPECPLPLVIAPVVRRLLADRMRFQLSQHRSDCLVTRSIFTATGNPLGMNAGRQFTKIMRPTLSNESVRRNDVQPRWGTARLKGWTSNSCDHSLSRQARVQGSIHARSTGKHRAERLSTAAQSASAPRHKQGSSRGPDLRVDARSGGQPPFAGSMEW